jgi:hypothetical protein
VVPSILSWRNKARGLVEMLEPLPAGGRPGKEFIEGRQRMETFLGIDKGVPHSPITVISLLAPFVTALLTTLVPVG